MSMSGLPGRRVEAMREGISTSVRVSVIGSEARLWAVSSAREMTGKGPRLARLYGLPEHGQTDISAWLGVQRESLIPGLIRGRLSGPSVDLQGLEPDPKWTPSNSTKLSVPFWAPAWFCS